MNNEVWATLMQAFALGYVEGMAGFQVEDDDVIDSETASEIATAAQDYINKAEDSIGANYIENPGQVHNDLYRAGRQAYLQAESLWMMRN